MTKALFRLFILFITCSTVISCSEQDSPELPDNPSNTNQGIASIDQTQINANGGGFIIRVKTDGTWQASSSETWCTLSRTSGNGNGSISGYMKANTGAERSVIITIIAGKEKAEFTLKQLAGNGSNPDPDPDPESLQDMQGGLKFQLCVLEICISSSHTLLKRITKRLLLIAMSMIVTKCILVGSHALLAPPLLTKMQEEMRTLQKIFHYLQHTDLEKKLFLVLTTVEDI